MKKQNTTLKYFKKHVLKLLRKSLDVLDWRLNMSLTTKVKVAKFSFLNEKSYNKTVIDFNFGSERGLGELSLFRVDKSLWLPNWSQ